MIMKKTAIIGHVTIRLPGPTSYRWSIVTMRLSSTVTEIWRLKDNGVTSLIFWGHVTSSITWPFDSRRSTSYRWSIVAMRLSSTVMKIWPLKFFREGSSRNRGRSLVGRRLVGRSSILHWSYTLLFATLGTKSARSKKLVGGHVKKSVTSSFFIFKRIIFYLAVECRRIKSVKLQIKIPNGCWENSEKL